jgi:hypothetical protein
MFTAQFWNCNKKFIKLCIPSAFSPDVPIPLSALSDTIGLTICELGPLQLDPAQREINQFFVLNKWFNSTKLQTSRNQRGYVKCMLQMRAMYSLYSENIEGKILKHYKKWSQKMLTAFTSMWTRSCVTCYER